MSSFNPFTHLSQLLTGFVDLPLDISEGYYEKLLITAGYKDYLLGINTWSQQASAIQDLIALASNDDKKFFKGLTFLWYTGELIPWHSLDEPALDKNRLQASQEEYYSGLIWKAIRAHPLGLSGGYYGYWKYEPEN